MIGTCVVFLSLLFTQFMLPVTVAGNTMYLYWVEFFIMLLFAGAFINILVKKEKINLGKTEFLLLALFVLWFLVLTVYRYFAEGSITGGFIVVRVLCFPIVLVLLLRQYGVKKGCVFAGLFAFLTCLNLYQLFNLIFVKQSFRQLQGLKNINIYLCFAVAALPLVFRMVASYHNPNKWINGLVKATAYFNILAVICFSVFSGSRIAVLVCPVVVIACCFLNLRFTKKSIVGFVVFVIIVNVLTYTIISAHTYDADGNLYRATGVDLRDVQENTETEQNVEDSNSMRSVLWKKSIYYISQNPIFGRHTIDIDCEMKFAGSDKVIQIMESPHNFILEMWLSLGLPGMLIYLLMVGLCAMKVFLSKIPAGRKISFLLVMAVIWGFSFFQPLVTCYFAVSLILWLSMYLFMESEDGVSAP